MFDNLARIPISVVNTKWLPKLRTAALDIAFVAIGTVSLIPVHPTIVILKSVQKWA